MAEVNQIIPQVQGLPEIAISTADPFNYFDLSNFRNQNLLRSCKFAIRIDRHPAILSEYRRSDLRQFSFLCDSIEFPGRSILTTDFNIPGRQKIRTPFKREFNEITLTFYHNTRFPIYEYFTAWEDEISLDSARTSYFSEITTNIHLFQFYDTTSNAAFLGLGGSGSHVKYVQMSVQLLNAYPISVSSLPSNWADDGFHKLSATFFYEETDNSRSRSARFAAQRNPSINSLDDLNKSQNSNNAG